MYIGSFLYLRAWSFIASFSICFGSSNIPANLYLKRLALGYLLYLRLSLRCAIKRPRMFDLTLLPIYTGTLFVSPRKYMPNIPFGNALTLSRVNLYHLLSTGITYSFVAVLPLYQFVNRYIKQDATHTMFNVWQTSRASLYPLALASSGELSR